MYVQTHLVAKWFVLQKVQQSKVAFHKAQHRKLSREVHTQN